MSIAKVSLRQRSTSNGREGLRQMTEDNLPGSEGAILIVDDSLQYSKVLSMLLKNAFGYQDITVVANMADADQAIEAEPDKFKLFFVDYHFPDGKNGGEFLRKLQDKSILNEAVAFLITAEPTIDNMQEAMRAGALGVVAKPFDRTQLANSLDKARRAMLQKTEVSF